MTALVVGLAFVVAVLAVLVVGLLRSHADILRALHTLGVGLDPEHEPAGRVGPVPVSPPVIRTQPGVPEPREGGSTRTVEPLVGTTPDGNALAVALAPRDHATLLAFLTTGCLTCAAFWDEFRGPVDLPGPGTRLVIVTQGAAQESPSAVRRLAPKEHVTLQSSEAWERFAVPGGPYFVLVDGSNGQVVGEGSATTWEHVRGLLAQSVDDGVVTLGSAEGRQRSLRATEAERRREAEVDAALARSGIGPGHPSLYGADDAPEVP